MAGRVTAQLALLVALCACHNEHPTAPPLPAANGITFTLLTTNLVVGDSELAIARVVDANGVVIDSAPVVWSTTNPSVAAVSSYGEVYGKGVGTAGIVAKSGSVADTVRITDVIGAFIAVDSIAPHQLITGQPATIYGHQFSTIPAANLITIATDSVTPVTADSTHLVFVLPDTSCLPAGTRTVTVAARGSTAQLPARFAPSLTPLSNLAVGAVEVLGPSSLGCLQVAANQNAATYIAIVTDVTSTLDAPFTFQIEQFSGDSAPLGWNGYSRVRPRLTHALPTRLVAPRSLAIRSSRPAHSPATPPGGASSASAAAAREQSVGDAVTFNVPLHGCDTIVASHGHIMAVGAHAIIAQDDSSANDGLAPTDFDSIAADVDAAIYPADTLHFGSPSDIDGNGRVILYYTQKVNELTTGDPLLVGGLFFNGDLMPTSTCKASNQGEILYLQTPTSSIPASTLLVQTRGTIAHVLEHLINASNHIRTRATAFEDPWLDEALAHSAEDFVGRAVSGFSDSQLLSFADINTNLNAYLAYFRPNAGRYSAWLGAPQNTGGADTTADTSQTARGASWSLLRYTLDHYSPGGAPMNLSRALAAGPSTGIYNLVTATGAALDSLIEGWLVANYATGMAIPNVATKYTFTSYNWQDVETGVNGSFSIASTPFAAGTAGQTGIVQANGGLYFTIANPAATSAFSIRLLSSSGTAITLAGARVYILRTQ